VSQQPSLAPETIERAAELTAAWLANPNTRASAEDVPAFLSSMHAALTGLSSDQQQGEAPAPEQTEYTPAVSVRKSLASPDHIFSMIDGKPYKTLRRHLARHGLTPEQYRERYGLKRDYPMVSNSYSQVRRDMVKKIGLRRKPGQQTGVEVAPAPEPRQAAETPPAKPARGRRRKAEAEAA
jgi:predicted transcriptional regulator